MSEGMFNSDINEHFFQIFIQNLKMLAIFTRVKSEPKLDNI